MNILLLLVLSGQIFKPTGVYAEKPTLKPASKLWVEVWSADYCPPCRPQKKNAHNACYELQVGYAEYNVNRRRPDRPVSQTPTTFIIKDGRVIDTIVGLMSKDELKHRILSLSPAPKIVEQPAEQPGRYTTYGGRTYDWERETYGKCSMRNCGMCNYLYNACWSYRRARGLTDASPDAASGDDIIKEALPLLKLGPSDVLGEIGCGDGRVLIHAAQLTGCQGVGIEIDESKVTAARHMIKAHGLSRQIEIIHGDARSIDLQAAGVTAVYAYLYPELLEELRPKLASVNRVVCPGHRCPGLDMQLVGQCWVKDSTRL